MPCLPNVSPGGAGDVSVSFQQGAHRCGAAYTPRQEPLGALRAGPGAQVRWAQRHPPPAPSTGREELREPTSQRQIGCSQQRWGEVAWLWGENQSCGVPGREDCGRHMAHVTRPFWATQKGRLAPGTPAGVGIVSLKQPGQAGPRAPSQTPSPGHGHHPMRWGAVFVPLRGIKASRDGVPARPRFPQPGSPARPSAGSPGPGPLRRTCVPGVGRPRSRCQRSECGRCQGPSPGALNSPIPPRGQALKDGNRGTVSFLRLLGV